MIIAITGATGFIGHNLVSYLDSRGYGTVALVRDLSCTPLFPESVILRQGDITNPSSMKEVFKDVDITIHLAAIFNKPGASWDDYYIHNVLGTENVMKAARKSGVKRVIHCSTGGVVAGNNRLPFDEKSPYATPQNDKYEITKCEGEKKAISFSDRNNFPVTVIRPTQPYGPGDKNKVKFYRMVKKGVIINPGSTLKHPIYIEDLCRAFELTLQNERSINEIITVGNRRSIRLTEMIGIAAKSLGVHYPKIIIPARPMSLICKLVEKLSNTIGITPPLHRGNMDFFTKSIAFDVSKAKRILDFQNNISVRDGMDHTVDWMKNQGIL